MIRLLTGPDGNDAWGRPIGVGPGEDVEATVLGGGRSMVCSIDSAKLLRKKQMSWIELL